MAAGKVYQRVRALECCITLVELIKAELLYTLAQPASLMRELQKRQAVKELSFLSRCDTLCRQGIAFPIAWRESVQESGKTMSLLAEDNELLLQMGELLGSTSLQGQIDQLERLKEQFHLQRERALEKYQTSGRLYRSLGILGGLAVVILLW